MRAKAHLPVHTAPELQHVDVPLVEFVYLEFTRMPGESYCRRLRCLLLRLCDVFRALINSMLSVLILHLQADRNIQYRCIES